MDFLQQIPKAFLVNAAGFFVSKLARSLYAIKPIILIMMSQIPTELNIQFSGSWNDWNTILSRRSLCSIFNVLNYFFYEFRYSHYLFWPQIFSSGENSAISSKISEKFWIVVPNANFLTNNDHDFFDCVLFLGRWSLLILLLVVLLRDRDQIGLKTKVMVIRNYKSRKI